MKKIRKRTEIGRRLAAPTPIFWKKLRRIGWIVASAAAIVATAGAAFPVVVTIAGLAGTAGSLTIFLSSLARKDGSIDWESMTLQQLRELRRLLGAKNEMTEDEIELFRLINDKIEG